MHIMYATKFIEEFDLYSSQEPLKLPKSAPHLLPNHKNPMLRLEVGFKTGIQMSIEG